MRVMPTDEEMPGLVPRPGSIVWRAAGDSRLLPTAGYALLLQVAHPTVGAGVAEHSNFAADPWGRLLRTLDYVHGSIYGGPRLAGQIGRRVRAMHTSIKGVRPDGTAYHALEPDAYAWVHATLAVAMIDGHRTLGAALGPQDQADFWRDWLKLGRLVGVRERDLPADWIDVPDYFQAVVDGVLEDTETVHVVLDSLARPLAPPVPALPPVLWAAMRAPAGRHVQLMTKGLLPPELRERFGLSWGAAERRLFELMAATSRASAPLIRGPLREFGPHYLRWRREALERGDVAAVVRPAA